MIILLVLWGVKLTNAERDKMIVWNIGQGSWATLVSAAECLHFDMGGTRYFQRIERLCRTKRNRLYLSHSDWDHISNAGRIRNRLRTFCLDRAPRDLRMASATKVKLINGIAKCRADPPERSGSQYNIRMPSRARANEIEFEITSRRPNDLSRIYFYRHWLLPGDSTKTAEKIWTRVKSASEFLPAVRIILLGHHGSNTSSSEDLLDRLPSLNAAIASAEWSKYGHPHREVRARLLQKRVPLITTEEWGNLIYEQ